MNLKSLAEFNCDKKMFKKCENCTRDFDPEQYYVIVI